MAGAFAQNNEVKSLLSTKNLRSVSPCALRTPAVMAEKFVQTSPVCQQQIFDFGFDWW